MAKGSRRPKPRSKLAQRAVRSLETTSQKKSRLVKAAIGFVIVIIGLASGALYPFYAIARRTRRRGR